MDGESESSQGLSRKEMRERQRLDILEYKFILRHIEREESLINRRIAWMLTFQGFLFATIALLANNQVSPSLRTNLEALSAIAGLLVGLLACIGVNAAYSSIKDKLNKWGSEKRQAQIADELKDRLPPITSKHASNGGKFLSYGLPLVFVLVWGTLLLQQFSVVQMLLPK
jgi:hypothetical protein